MKMPKDYKELTLWLCYIIGGSFGATIASGCGLMMVYKKLYKMVKDIEEEEDEE